MSDPDWDIVEYCGLEGLRQLEAPWKRLYQGMPDRSRYHTYEGQLAYLTHLCPNPASSRYVAFFADGEAKAICPLDSGRQRIAGLRLKVSALPRHSEWQVTDIIAPEDETRAALVPRLVRYLRETSPVPALLVLGPLPTGSTLWRHVPDLPAADYCSHPTTGSYVFDCTAPFDELIARPTSKFRQTLRRGERRAEEELGGVRLVVERAGDGASQALETLMAVEASGWKGEGGSRVAIRLDPHLVGFFRDWAAMASGPEDGCEFVSLYAGERCVATSYCMRTGSEYAGIKIGHDPEFRNLGPGHLLFREILKRCCADPTIRRFNICGTSAWADPWKPDLIRQTQYHFRISPGLGRAGMVALKFRYGARQKMVAQVRSYRQAPERAAAR